MITYRHPTGPVTRARGKKLAGVRQNQDPTLSANEISNNESISTHQSGNQLPAQISSDASNLATNPDTTPPRDQISVEGHASAALTAHPNQKDNAPTGSPIQEGFPDPNVDPPVAMSTPAGPRHHAPPDLPAHRRLKSAAELLDAIIEAGESDRDDSESALSYEDLDPTPTEGKFKRKRSSQDEDGSPTHSPVMERYADIPIWDDNDPHSLDRAMAFINEGLAHTDKRDAMPDATAPDHNVPNPASNCMNIPASWLDPASPSPPRQRSIHIDTPVPTISRNKTPQYDAYS
ncbi:hypothetical protein NLI96_g13277 [Meripilus lineatus]|uniref:Uncharacterized protein n=1 Tax=Meripilus lineatus TaxID=2056292 RepID=A0AAD5UQ77_9APHY|nr:hypothetical protein NLI96_g13277 [Physisporinus lineatus]